MKQPTLEEVKEYFKDADTIKSCNDRVLKMYEDCIEQTCIGFSYRCSETGHLYLIVNSKSEYAEILTYKEKTFSITESQINELSNTMNVCDKLKEWFPEAFESEVKLEVGKWYKETVCFIGNMFVYIESIQDKNNVTCYGFNGIGEWFDSISGFGTHGLELATEQELFEALKNEAVKRGFVKGTYFKDLHISKPYKLGCVDKIEWFSDSEDLRSDGWCIFHKGKWAEIIPTITLSEAEQKLGKKIIV